MLCFGVNLPTYGVLPVLRGCSWIWEGGTARRSLCLPRAALSRVLNLCEVRSMLRAQILEAPDSTLAGCDDSYQSFLRPWLELQGSNFSFQLHMALLQSVFVCFSFLSPQGTHSAWDLKPMPTQLVLRPMPSLYLYSPLLQIKSQSVVLSGREDGRLRKD